MNASLLPIAGILLGAAFWLMDAWIGASAHAGMETFTTALLQPEANALQRRLLAVILLLGFSLYARRLVSQPAQTSAHNASIHHNHLPLACIHWDQQLRTLSWNSAAEHLLGYSHQQTRGQAAITWLLCTEDQHHLKTLMDTVTKDRQWDRRTLKTRTREGHTLLCQWQSQALPALDGKQAGIATFIQDVTEQETLRKSFQHLDAQWEQAIDFFSDPIYLVDLNDRLIKANRAFFTMKSLTPEQVIGRNIMEIMHPQGEDPPCPVCLARRERRDARLTMEADHPNNHVGKPFEVMLCVIRDENQEATGILMCMRDLSEQRAGEAELRKHRDHLEELVAERTQQLEASNRELESFSYSVSHDLRAPVRIIDGFSRILAEEYVQDLDIKAHDYIRRILGNTERMERLIDDLLNLSHMSRAELHITPVDLASMAEKIINDLRSSEPSRQVQFIRPDKLHASGDRTLLRVMLENLLRNAWKYTGKKMQTQIEIGQIQQAGKKIYFIRDNGAGFDMAYVHKLFGAFQRLHSRQEFPGNGVGLATVQRIIHRHGGTIWAEGKPGEGASFYFTLPAHTQNLIP